MVSALRLLPPIKPFEHRKLPLALSSDKVKRLQGREQRRKLHFQEGVGDGGVFTEPSEMKQGAGWKQL